MRERIRKLKGLQRVLSENEVNTALGITTPLYLDWANWAIYTYAENGAYYLHTQLFKDITVDELVEVIYNALRM